MNELQQKLVESGNVLTKPRLAVLDYLVNNHSPLSARELHKKLKHFDRASVYRTLNLFEDLHLVNVEIVDKEKIYCLAGEPHHHIVCTGCGYMEEIECKHSFKDFKNFTNIFHQLTLTGMCNKCALSK